MIEIEIQNETNQSQERVRFAAVPRIGEGIRLKGPDGFWASFDVLDLWYQKAEFGDIWVPYLHVRMTEGERVPAGSDTVADVGADTPELDDLAEDEMPDEGIEEWRMASLNR